MQYQNISNLRHLGMVKLKHWQNACKTQEILMLAKRKRNACVLLACTFASVLQAFCMHFARVCF